MGNFFGYPALCQDTPNPHFRHLHHDEPAGWNDSIDGNKRWSRFETLPFVFSGVEEDVLDMIRNDKDMLESFEGLLAKSNNLKTLNDMRSLREEPFPITGIRQRCLHRGKEQPRRLKTFKIEAERPDPQLEEGGAKLGADGQEEVLIVSDSEEYYNSVVAEMNRTHEKVENEIQIWIDEIDELLLTTEKFAENYISRIDDEDDGEEEGSSSEPTEIISVEIHAKSWKNIC